MWRTVPLLMWCMIPVCATGGAATAADLQQGRKVFQAHCAECHGSQGRGDGPKARELGFHPRDFALGAYKCRCTESGQLPTDEDLMRTITNGMPGTAMRPFGNLPVADRQALVQYVKTFSPRFASEPQPKCDDASQPPPPTATAILEGKQIYRALVCWQCHGIQGRGDGPAAAGLKDDWGKPVRAYDFTVGKRLKCGGEDQDLYRTLLTGMNGSPMPSYREAMLFAGDAVTDLTQYKAVLGTGELQELSAYLGQQPKAAEVKIMPPAARQELIQRRAWALVYYLKSLLASVPGGVRK